jgi:hypothetical protein
MKKIPFFSLICTLSCVTAHLLANETGNSTAGQAEKPTYTAKAIAEQNVHGTLGGKNPAHTTSKGPLITADFLYWRADEDGMEFANEVKTHGAGTSLQGNSLNLHGEWKPGVRAGLGWLFGACDQWDLYANWTYFRDKAHMSASTKNPRKFFVPTWSNILGASANSPQASWTLNVNLLDLEIGRNYFISRKIALHPHVGLRGAWINQSYHADYTGAWFFSNLPGPVVNVARANTSFKAENNFKGIGVCTGADLMWHFTDHFGILTELAASLLYGNFKINEHFNGARPAIIDATTGLISYQIQEKKDFNRVRANIEAFIGLFFETGLYHDRYHFTLSAGYELSEWFQQNEMVSLFVENDVEILGATPSIPVSLAAATNRDMIAIRQSGNLGFQGLTIKAAFNF